MTDGEIRALAQALHEVLTSAGLYTVVDGRVVAADTEALKREVVDTFLYSAFPADYPEPERRFNPESDSHQALSCLRDFLSGDGAGNITGTDAKHAVDLLIKKEGMR